MSGTRIIGFEDRAGWDAVMGSRPHDISHTWSYHALAREQGEGEPVLVTWTDGAGSHALPLLVRDIDGTRRDATSVYGYPGPVSRRADPREPEGSLDEALDELGLVSAFTRLNPMLETRVPLRSSGTIVDLGICVTLDLTTDAARRRAQYSRSTRRRLAKLTDRHDVDVVIDHDLAHLDRFADLHRQAMRRVGAPPSYHHDAAYFRRLHAHLGDACTLVVCTVDGDLAAAGIYLRCDGIVQAHLAADDPGLRHLSPQRAEIDGAASLFADLGDRWLNLGGGVGSGDDELLSFKRGFGGVERRFGVWRHIVEPDDYDDLCRTRHVDAGDGDYFPAYRDPSRDGAVVK